MGFINSKSKIDLDCTPLENMFINNYMTRANGTHVKVFIYGFSVAKSQDSARDFSNRTIARDLSLSIEDVLGAWDYWESKKIIRKHIGDDPVDYDIEFLSIREMYIDGIKSGSAFRSEEMTTDDFVAKNETPSYAVMFHDCEAILMKELVFRQRRAILDLMAENGLSPDIVVKSFDYSVKSRNVRDFKYVMSVLSAWASKGIKNASELQAHLETEGERETFFRKVYRLIGISGRQVASGDREIMASWMDDLGFTPDFIEKVINSAVSSTTNPNFNYFDKVFKRLKSEGITTFEAYAASSKSREKGDSASSGGGKTAAGQPQAASKIQRPNKFNDIQTNRKKYSNEELEKMLLSNKKDG